MRRGRPAGGDPNRDTAAVAEFDLGEQREAVSPVASKAGLTLRTAGWTCMPTGATTLPMLIKHLVGQMDTVARDRDPVWRSRTPACLVKLHPRGVGQ